MKSTLVSAFAVAAMSASIAFAGDVVVFHADSLAGPMKALKAAFEARQPGVNIQLNSGVSKQLAERILKGDTCDVFAPSSPPVIDQDLMDKPVAGSGKPGATWYVVFSANEMAIIVAKGNPKGIAHALDLAKPGMKLARVTGEKDLATARTVEFLKRAATLEGDAAAAPILVDGAIGVTNIPEAVSAVKEGKADAAVVYFSAAVAAKDSVDIVRFPASVNLSEAIRNAATVPGTAANAVEATAFVAFLVTPQAQEILMSTGQPPVVPAVRMGVVPAEVK
jgi:molybdate transport system substrate-binding protein